MMTLTKPLLVLGISGSLREASYNTALLHAAVDLMPQGMKLDIFDLSPLPMFNQDLEKPFPEAVVAFRDRLVKADAILIAAPEYNSSITAVLKNTIDWVSRPVPGEAPLACFDGKAACIMSASPGALGGLRGLVHVRAILQNIRVLVLPDQIAIVKADEAFNPDGSLKDPKQQAAVEALGAKLARVIAKLHG